MICCSMSMSTAEAGRGGEDAPTAGPDQDAQWQRLERAAEDRGMSVASLVRAAIEPRCRAGRRRRAAAGPSSRAPSCRSLIRELRDELQALRGRHMIVMDTTVLVYAVGVTTRWPTRATTGPPRRRRQPSTTTVEVLQESAHVRARRRGRPTPPN